SNNEFYNFEAGYFQPLYIQYCDYIEIQNNYSHDFNADYYYNSWSMNYCNDISFSFNEYSNYTSQWENYSIFYFYECYTARIEGNSIHDLEAGYIYSAFELYYCDDVQLINNLYYNNKPEYENSQVFMIIETHNINYAHNTVVIDDAS